MAYGIIKVDTVTFTNAGIDKSVSLSGLVQNPTFSGNVTVTGTLSGVTVTGTTASFTSGVFTNISGGTHTITSGVFAAGSAASPSISFVSDPDTGVYSPGANQVALSTNGTGRLFVDASGNVGFGAAAPTNYKTYIKQVGTWGLVLEAASDDSRLLVGDTNSEFRFSASYAGTGSYRPLTFFTSDLERLRITADGKVGVGTSSPATALHVSGSGTQRIRITGTGAANAILTLDAPSGYTNYIEYGASASTPLAFYDVAAAAERLRITANGRVGVGISAPNAPLTVASEGGLNLALVGRNNNPADEAQLYFMRNNGSTLQALIAVNNDNLSFHTGSSGTERLRIDVNGNVGIGSISPGSFQSASSTVLSLRDAATNNVASLKVLGGAGAGAIAEYGATNGVGFCGTAGAHPFTIYTNSQERLRITADGNVVVGGTTAAISGPGRGNVTINGASTAVLGLSVGGVAKGWVYHDNTNLEINAGSTGAMIAYTANTERLRITADGKVGVGTSAPTSLLHVSGTTSTPAIFERTGSAGAFIGLKDGVGTLSYIGNTNGVFSIQTPGSGYSDKLVVTSDGKVGVGTSSPEYTFDCRGQGAFELFNATGGGSVLNLRPSLGDANKYNMSISSYDHSGGGVGNADGLSINGYDGVSICTGSSTARQERLRVTEAGLVGVGTASPNTTLSIGAFASSSYNGGVCLNRGPSSYNFYEASDGTNSVIFGLDNNLTVAKIGSINSYPIGFFTGNTERLRIASNGDINLLDNALYLTKTGLGNGQITFDGSTYSIISNSSTAPLVLGTFSQERLRITSAGLVGIGTSSVSYKLDINNTSGGNGGFRLLSTDQSTTRIRLENTGTGGRIYEIVGGLTGVNNSTFTVYDATAAATRLAIDSSGNVGVGTSAPAEKLEVQDGSISVGSTQNISQTNTLIAGYGYALSGTKYGNTSIRSTYNNSNNAAGLEFYTSPSLSAATERLRITADGKVGVGTSSPSEALTVVGNISSFSNSGTNHIASSLAGTTTSYLITDSSGANIQVDGAWPIRFTTNSAERARIDSSGRVGIGTATPGTYNANLAVYSSGGAFVGALHANASGTFPKASAISLGSDAVSYTYTTDGASVALKGSAHIAALQSASSGAGTDIAFINTSGGSASEKARLDSSGRVGIGTTSPASILHCASSGDNNIRIVANGQTAQLGVDNGTPFVGTPSGAFNFYSSGQLRATLDSSGRLLVGTSSARSSSTVSWAAQIEGTNLTGLGITNNQATSGGAYFSLAKSRGTTVGSNTIVQAGDLLGAILFSGADGTDVDTQAAYIGCEVDGTPGANTMPGRLIFNTTSTTPGAPPTERMRITNDGYILLDGSLGAVGMRLGSAGQLLLIANNGGLFHQAGGNYYLVTTAGGSTSDINLKKDIAQIEEPLQKLKQIRGVTFSFIDEQVCSSDRGEQIGVIAQEVEKVFPQAVVTGDDGVKSVRYDKLTAPLIEAVNSLASVVSEQSALIEDLAQRLAVLES